MRGLLLVLLVIACPLILTAGAAGTSESDPVKSEVDASAPSASMNSNGKQEPPAEIAVVEKPIPPVANPDVLQHDPTAAKEEKPVEQTSSAPAADADEGKRGDEFAAAPESRTGSAAAQETRGPTDTICSMLELAAAANGLPLEFFARVIWQESRFDHAIGPTTRTGHQAQGIAQFMPYTAAERGLLNPLDPETALPEAAEFLAELRREFGNLGLAAAAYNAGPGRVRDFIDGRGDMPAQTRHYVRAITGRSVEEWAALGRETGKDGIVRPTSCRFLTALLKEPPVFSIGSMERKLRQAAFRPGGIPDGRNASAVQSLTKRVTAGPMKTRTARNKQFDTASLPSTAARPSPGRSAASPDSIKQKATRTHADPKLASVRLRIVSPKSIVQETARGVHSKGSSPAQNSKPVPVQTASLLSGGAARQPKVSPSVASAGSRSSSAAPTEARKSTVAGSRLGSAASTLRESKAAPARLRTVTPAKSIRERSTKVTPLRASTAGRTTADRVAEHRKIEAALTQPSCSSATRAKPEGQTGQLVTPPVSTRSKSRLASEGVRGVARNDVVKTSEERLRKIMQYLSGVLRVHPRMTFSDLR